ncbi:MAG: RNA polymerase sigma factor [Gemmatimonadales bacterium]
MADAELPAPGEPLGLEFRAVSRHLIALLTRRAGADRLAQVEDAVQDAFVAALRAWGPQGARPADPVAWLYRTAWNRMVDQFRRIEPASLGATDAALIAEPHPPSLADLEPDAELRLVLLCCHPTLSIDSQVALTLKVAAGFSVSEIARLLGAATDAVDQRLVRAKRLLRQSGVELDPAPGDLARRAAVALEVLYGMFSEGYASLTAPTGLRRELCIEALRLSHVMLADRATASPAGHALAALFAFHLSRLDTRFDDAGMFQSLRDQDRSRWNRKAIAIGLDHLRRSTGPALTRFHLEAEIASCHAVAGEYGDTDWTRIIMLYDGLLQQWPTRNARLARAIAIGERDGPRAGIEALSALPDQDDDPVRLAALAHCYEQAGEPSRAHTIYRQALSTTSAPGLRRVLEGALDRSERTDVGSGQVHPS